MGWEGSLQNLPLKESPEPYLTGFVSLKKTYDIKRERGRGMFISLRAGQGYKEGKRREFQIPYKKIAHPERGRACLRGGGRGV